MKWIKLTAEDDRQILVNLDHVALIEPTHEDELGAYLYFADGKAEMVKTSIEKLGWLLREDAQ